MSGFTTDAREGPQPLHNHVKTRTAAGDSYQKHTISVQGNPNRRKQSTRSLVTSPGMALTTSQAKSTLVNELVFLQLGLANLGCKFLRNQDCNTSQTGLQGFFHFLKSCKHGLSFDCLQIPKYSVEYSQEIQFPTT